MSSELRALRRLFQEYTDQFGQTFTVFHVYGELAERMMEEMRRAVAGERDEITDEELGLEIPDGAQLSGAGSNCSSSAASAAIGSCGKGDPLKGGEDTGWDGFVPLRAVGENHLLPIWGSPLI